MSAMQIVMVMVAAAASTPVVMAHRPGCAAVGSLDVTKTNGTNGGWKCALEPKCCESVTTEFRGNARLAVKEFFEHKLALATCINQFFEAAKGKGLLPAEWSKQDFLAALDENPLGDDWLMAGKDWDDVFKVIFGAKVEEPKTEAQPGGHKFMEYKLKDDGTYEAHEVVETETKAGDSSACDISTLESPSIGKIDWEENQMRGCKRQIENCNSMIILKWLGEWMDDEINDADCKELLRSKIGPLILQALRDPNEQQNYDPKDDQRYDPNDSFDTILEAIQNSNIKDDPPDLPKIFEALRGIPFPISMPVAPAAK